MAKWIVSVAETEHYEIEVEADSEAEALEKGMAEWREAPDVGGYQIADTETDYTVHEKSN